MILDEFLKAIPKIELHCHLYGTVRKETFADMARRRGAPFSTSQIDEYYTRSRKPYPNNNVLRALDEHLVKAPEDLYRITSEYLIDAAAENVRYSEFSWNPTATLQGGIPYVEAQSAIVWAIRDAEKRSGIIGRVVAAIDRERGPEAAIEMVDWVSRYRTKEVPGIGMDFNEADGPPELFVEAYRRAGAAGLRRTAHAGENGMPWSYVQTALDQLNVERVEHGYTVIDNPQLVERCRDRGVVFTVVPTNSYYLRTLPDDRWRLDHPIRQMAALGLRVHPNTDNPTLHKVTATRAWRMMIEDFGCPVSAVREFIINGLDAAWISNSQRTAWKQDWVGDFDRLVSS